MKRKRWLLFLVTPSKLAKSPLICLADNEKIENQRKTSYLSASALAFLDFLSLSLTQIPYISVNESKAT